MPNHAVDEESKSNRMLEDEESELNPEPSQPQANPFEAELSHL